MSVFDVELGEEDRIPEGYDIIRLQDLEDTEEFSGEATMTSIEPVIFDQDGEEVTKYRSRLQIVNDDTAEVLSININLKTGEEIQKNVRMSVLFDFLKSVLNCAGEWDISKNMIKKANIEEFVEYINESSKITIIKKTVNTSNFSFNSFEVIDMIFE